MHHPAIHSTIRPSLSLLQLLTTYSDSEALLGPAERHGPFQRDLGYSPGICRSTDDAPLRPSELLYSLPTLQGFVSATLRRSWVLLGMLVSAVCTVPPSRRAARTLLSRQDPSQCAWGGQCHNSNTCTNTICLLSWLFR